MHSARSYGVARAGSTVAAAASTASAAATAAFVVVAMVLARIALGNNNGERCVSVSSLGACPDPSGPSNVVALCPLCSRSPTNALRTPSLFCGLCHPPSRVTPASGRASAAQSSHEAADQGLDGYTSSSGRHLWRSKEAWLRRVVALQAAQARQRLPPPRSPRGRRHPAQTPRFQDVLAATASPALRPPPCRTQCVAGGRGGPPWRPPPRPPSRASAPSQASA